MAFSSKIFTAPKIGKGNISSPLSSGASKITKATPKLRVNRINFGNRRVASSPVLESQSSIESTLSETNKILVDIQKQLALDFSMRIADEKEKNNTLKEEKSKRKFALKEGSIESVKKIGSIVKSGASAVLAPVESAFDKIIEFITLIGAGVATNTVFNWLSDDANKKKLSGWFDWIKENWQWAAATVGAIALLPLIGTISGILGPIGAIVGLFAKAVPLLLGLLLNPIFLKAMLAIGAGVLIFKGGQILVNEVRKIFTGSQGFSDAHDQLDQKLRDAGLDQQGRTLRTGRGGRGGRPELTQEQIEVRDSVMKKREQLKELSKNMTEEIKSERSKIMGNQMGRSASRRNASALKESKLKITQEYEAKISTIMGNVEARAKGGPVQPGTPYLVGEEGPELRVFEKGGSIISNPKTKNLLRNITPNKTKKTNIVTMDLPPQMLNSEKSPPARPAEPPIPKIPSTNVADMWRSKTPEMYGISV